MAIWIDPATNKILLVPYGANGIGDCLWCPCWCPCCPGLIPNLGIDGGIDGPSLTVVINKDGTDVATLFLVNGTDGGVSSGPCAWLGFTEDETYIIDTMFQDFSNGCKWTMTSRNFGLDCFDTLIVATGDDASACTGTVTFSFSCGGHTWVVTVTIPTMMLVEPKKVEEVKLDPTVAKTIANRERMMTLSKRGCNKCRKKDI